MWEPFEVEEVVLKKKSSIGQRANALEPIFHQGFVSWTRIGRTPLNGEVVRD
jgi:hypothetical protein